MVISLKTCAVNVGASNANSIKSKYSRKVPMQQRVSSEIVMGLILY